MSLRDEMPRLGFGMMRLPERDGKIDMPLVCQMVDRYLEKGLNYFDSAYVYHGGMSEVAMREAIVKRYDRETFRLATKLPAWELHSKDDVQRIFDEQLKRAGVEYFDNYLLHSIEEGHLANYNKYDCWDWAMRMKEQGKIRHFGFSFHDSPELLDRILSEHPEAEFAQLQINYADWNNPIVQSGKCYAVAEKHDKPIIVMEPVKGGTLASLRPELEEMYRSLRPEKSVASWALRFVASHKQVMTTLSGMSDLEQMVDNLDTMTNFEPLSEEEQRCVDKVAELMLSNPTIPCTGCRYCTDGCPQQIRIPDIFRAANTIKTYGEHDRPHFFYMGLTEGGTAHTAASCLHCGQCESVCPQHLNIIELLEEASAVFDQASV